ncbi:tropomyosin isoform X6 [Copidosoma floridanum]|uniref:tropomyosin isoform X6 n=1 Tax=Copidosoma floridanum TaxID=29053 RepID=UPI0006C952C7|nr:tropomyosin isoform X6 [Copidosoma floridanum]
MEPVLSSTSRRRGHQHHPRNATRRRLDLHQNQQTTLIVVDNNNQTTAAKTTTTTSSSFSSTPDKGPAQCGPVGAAEDAIAQAVTVNSPRRLPSRRVLGASRPNSLLETNSGDAKIIRNERPAQCGRDDEVRGSRTTKPALGAGSFSDDDNDEESCKSPELEHAVARARGDGNSDEESVVVEEDPEIVELAKLRCPSERTEVQAEREARRRKRCADYPGLAFGCSIFSSDTMMKFSLIRNELQNIMGNQLKRAESEVAALNRRIQLLEEDLERSEERLATATAKLAEASQAADESERIRKTLENRTNMEDERVALLEQQLAQAKLIAEEADKKYEEAARKLVMMEQDLERAEVKAEMSETKIVELEEELRVVGNNLKSLEVSEEKATQREENFEGQVKILDNQLKEAEARAEFAERSVQKLQKEVDRLEDELFAEREKNKLLQDEMEATLHDIQNM